MERKEGGSALNKEGRDSKGGRGKERVWGEVLTLSVDNNVALLFPRIQGQVAWRPTRSITGNKGWMKVVHVCVWVLECVFAGWKKDAFISVKND